MRLSTCCERSSWRRSPEARIPPLTDVIKLAQGDGATHDGSVTVYPPETDLLTALPRLCISSPIPRIVAQPSETKTTKSSVQISNLFFFIFYPLVRSGAAATKAVTALTGNSITESGHSANTTVQSRSLPINPLFAQLDPMFLGLLFGLEPLAPDSLNLDERSELSLLVNNTN